MGSSSLLLLLIVLQIRFREVAPKLVQLLTEWTETFPYDFRDERMMRCLKDMTHQLARADEVSGARSIAWTLWLTIQSQHLLLSVVKTEDRERDC